MPFSSFRKILIQQKRVGINPGENNQATIKSRQGLNVGSKLNR